MLPCTEIRGGLPRKLEFNLADTIQLVPQTDIYNISIFFKQGFYKRSLYFKC